jgi:2'-5' RNA ligase
LKRDEKAMDDFKDSVMVALLPVGSSWCKIELPHLTLVYAGEIKDLKPGDFNKIAKDAASIAVMNRPITLTVTGLDSFGYSEDQKVDVLRFQSTTELDAMRHVVESWNKSEFPFRPHATMGPVGTRMLVQQHIPEYVTFDRVLVGWGKETLTFLMKVAGY